MTSHEDTKTRMAMRIGLCALATLFLAGHAMAAGWDGFPLSTNTATGWYSLHQAHEPMRQIVEAYRERFAAVGADAPTYVETYTVDAGVTNELYAPDLAWYLTWGNWLGYDEPDAQGRYLIYYNGADVWVTPLQVNASGGPELTYVLYSESPLITNLNYLTRTVTITNTPDDFKFGEFTVDVDGNSYTGHAYVTHGLLDMLWRGLANQLGSNSVWLVPEHATNAAWYSDPNLIDYRLVGNMGSVPFFTSDYPYEKAPRDYYMDYSYTGWTVNLPPPPRLSPAYVWDKHDLGRIGGRSTNAIGMVTGGTVSFFDPPTNLSFAVVLAEASYTRTNRVNISTNEVAQWTNYYGWVSRTLTNEAGIDYTNAVLGDNPKPVLVYPGTNSTEGISVTITGTAYVVTSTVTTNAAITNTAWNKDYDFPIFNTTNVIAESFITNRVVGITNGISETLNPGDQSAYHWHTISGFEATGLPASNRVTSLALVWTNSAWLPVSNRLYAIQLDRLYHTLNDMRFVFGGPPAAGGILQITNTVYGYMPDQVGGTTNFLEFDVGQAGGPAGSYTEAEDQPRRNYGDMPDWWSCEVTIADTNTDPYYLVYQWTPTNRPPAKAAAMATVRQSRESSWTTSSTLLYAELQPPYCWSIRQVECAKGGYARVLIGDDMVVTYTPSWAVYSERAQAAKVELEINTHATVSTRSRAFVMVGDYSGMYATNIYSLAAAALPGYRRGPSMMVNSGPTTAEPRAIENQEMWGYWGYPFNGMTISSPMEMHINLSTGWSETNRYPAGTIGSTSIPARAVEPMYIDIVGGRRVWTELRGYQATTIWVVLEWDFEYGAGE